MPRTPKTAWGMSSRIEQQYNRSLQNVNRLIMRELQGANTTEEISRRLRVIQNSPEFTNFSQNMAANMAAQVYRESNIHWRKLASEANRRRGSAIFQELQNTLNNTPMGGIINDIVRENAQLIKTMPSRLDAEATARRIKENAMTGARSSSLVGSLMQDFPGMMEYQLTRIARTETAKAQSALTRCRAESLGIGWYIWRTAQDGMRVRAGHRHMEGVLVNWNNPPNPETLIGGESTTGPYHAGNIWNCRCYAEPLIDVDWVDWPHKVYIGGAIVTMTREQFLGVQNDFGALQTPQESVIIERDDPYSQERKDKALSTDDPQVADSSVRNKSGEVWRNATDEQKDAIYDYTGSSHVGMNADLRSGGFDRGSLDDTARERIDNVTDIINDSQYDFDMWLQRGANKRGLHNFFEINQGDFDLPENELARLLVGTEPQDLGFFSTSAAKNSGFVRNKEVIMEIYAPRGTRMMYVEPISAHGRGAGLSWDGLSSQASFGSEVEMLVQRGTRFRVLDVKKTGRQINVAMEIIEQGVAR